MDSDPFSVDPPARRARKKKDESVSRDVAKMEGQPLEEVFAGVVNSLSAMLPYHPAAVDVEMTFKAVSMTKKGFFIPRKTDESTMEIRLATQIPSAQNRPRKKIAVEPPSLGG